MSSRKAEKEHARAERLASEKARSVRIARSRQLKLLGATSALALATVAAAIAISTGAGKGDAIIGGPDIEERLKGIPQNGLVLGNPRAPVTLVEYADLKCPFCRRFSTDIMPELVDRYVSEGRMKIEFRPQAFVGEAAAPGDSRAAATIALAAARQHKFWNFSELFYANQKEENTRYATDEFLRGLAQAIPGLNVTRAFADRDGTITQLDRSEAEFAAHPEFGGTPSFLIGRGGDDLESLEVTELTTQEFTTAIDALIK